MPVVLKTFNVQTEPYCDVINITDKVHNALKDSGLFNGMVCVHVGGSTAAISTLEYEPGLVKTDVEKLLEKIIPYNKDYAHHKTWGDHNGAGHLRSFLIGTSKTFPFQSGRLLLGTWQQIVLIELDEKPRSRKIYCQFIGE